MRTLRAIKGKVRLNCKNMGVELMSTAEQGAPSCTASPDHVTMMIDRSLTVRDIEVMDDLVSGWESRLRDLTGRMGHLFARPEPPEVFDDLVEGLLSDLEKEKD
jgi:hypothetical protein